MLKDIDGLKIIKEENLNDLFKSAFLKDISESCKILSTDFF